MPDPPDKVCVPIRIACTPGAGGRSPLAEVVAKVHSKGFQPRRQGNGISLTGNENFLIPLGMFAFENGPVKLRRLGRHLEAMLSQSQEAKPHKKKGHECEKQLEHTTGTAKTRSATLGGIPYHRQSRPENRTIS